MAIEFGPWVRLEGVSVTQLPPGATSVQPSNPRASSPSEASKRKDSGSISAPNVPTFIASLLSESIPFIDGVAPKSGGSPAWKVKGTPKKFASSDAPVQLYEYTVLGKELDQVEGMNHFSADRKDEYWVCRRSCHKNEVVKGSASWDEFVHSFKDHHAESEREFTPTVMAAREALAWDTEGVEVEVFGQKWNNITMVVEESKHRIDPKPLNNRTFAVVLVTAQLDMTQEFIVISIPLTDFRNSPYAEFAKDKTLVAAAYASIERIRILGGDVEWIMATASNAKGVLPQWLQNMAVPAAIAKDVDLFMTWIPSQRGVSATNE